MEQLPFWDKFSHIVALIRDGHMQQAKDLLVSLRQQAPETFAQWVIVHRLLHKVDADYEQSIEVQLRDYGTAPARAYRAALRILDQDIENDDHSRKQVLSKLLRQGLLSIDQDTQKESKSVQQQLEQLLQSLTLNATAALNKSDFYGLMAASQKASSMLWSNSWLKHRCQP